MKDLLGDIDRWRRSGERIAVARVVDIEGSGPRLPGAAMAVTESGEVAGSVSGGCVEGAVVGEALSILEGTTEPPRRHLRVLRRRGVCGRADVRRHDPSVHRGVGVVSDMPIFERYAGAARLERPRGVGHGDRRRARRGEVAGHHGRRRRTRFTRPSRTRPSGGARCARRTRSSSIRCAEAMDLRARPRRRIWSTSRPSACSSSRTLPHRRCGSSGPSISPRRSPASPRCSGTG